MHRPLSITEHNFWLYDQVAIFNFAMTAQIAGDINISKLEQALDFVQQRHPLLRVGIVLDTARKPWFQEYCAKIPLRVVQRLGEEHWQQEVEKEITQPFDWRQAPLIRVVLVHSPEVSELIVTVHHSIGDALASVYLLRDILQAVGLPNSERNILPLRPGCEDMIAEKLWGFHNLPSLENINTEVSPSIINDFTNAAANTFVDWRCLRLLAWSLSAAETTSLISRCREEQTTVHAAICAAFLLAVSQDSGQQFELKCISPINVRGFLAPLIAEDYGYYAAVGITRNSVTPDLTLWDIARSLKSQLHQQMTLEHIAEKIAPSQAFLNTNPSPQQLQQGFVEGYNHDIVVSNLGRLNIPQQFGDIQLKAIYGPAVTTYMKNERLIGVATLGDKMFFTFTYLDPETSPEKAVQIQQTAMEQLKQAQALKNEVLSMKYL
ncbi:alcohol acetyltransferase [Calothrix sp. NIES-2100]|uniref:phthiocerol/phthiodiolone dimycocerosyl transferase family protein n=1 Tax=Calothrix sp. NIES-2100 TaxID=1954172 RepID=UPI000B5F5845|nr:alcohol acetyltransferase [Calothrix sp. NIES-2100]